MHFNRYFVLFFAAALYLPASLNATKPNTTLDITEPSNSRSCYTENKPNHCIPKFMSLTYGRRAEATNTCGFPYIENYCLRSSVQAASGQNQYCMPCDQTNRSLSHDVGKLTDYHVEGSSATFWQSQTLKAAKVGSSKYNVNITIDFGIQSQVTYIWLRFQSPRPHSMAIYRKVTADSNWQPWAFFSKNCRRMYGMEPDLKLTAENRTSVLCHSAFSDLVPLSGGSIPFLVLHQRSNLNGTFWSDQALQNFTLARQIRISLDKLNTHGDIFLSPTVLNRYFYSIRDITAGGRCHCNGHATICDTVVETQERYCRCEHNTKGVQCDQCKEGFRDRPWRAATPGSDWECGKCNCSGNSDTCEFDLNLYEASGRVSGGRCSDCRGNTRGAHCELCLPNHRRRILGAGDCVPCQCHRVGSVHGQCDESGQCQCRSGVAGEKCEKCKDGFYNLTADGCRSCGCSASGVVQNSSVCHPASGRCFCKPNVAGDGCDVCRPGYFGLDVEDPDGCQRCFCYGHASNCRRLDGLSQMSLKLNATSLASSTSATFVAGDSKSGRLSTGTVISSTVGIFPEFHVNSSGVSLIPPYDSVYFSLPAEMLGNMSFAYNRRLLIDIHLPAVPVADSGLRDVLLTSGQKQFYASFDRASLRAGRSVATFRLAHDPASSVWRQLEDSHEEFRNVLTNLTGVYIRTSFSGTAGTIFASVYNVVLESATPAVSGDARSPAKNVHVCDCPDGHIGAFCEKCAPGYTRETPGSGPYGRCVPCRCNGHADQCDSETGVCGSLSTESKRVCRHNTAGDHCERCADGYFGNATSGQPDACKKCPCPDGSPCTRDPLLGLVVCSRCPTGRSGRLCELCDLGFFGRSPDCRPCDCNGNSDPNDLQVCDRTTGRCRGCVKNTGGPRCEICKNGYYGNALATGGANCSSCGCDPDGTQPSETCDSRTGACKCRPHVSGRLCDSCVPGFFNISSGVGCLSCACNFTGTNNSAVCSLTNGQCQCLPGVTGRTCDRCEKGFFNFTSKGCQPCRCSLLGSNGTECDAFGRCRCRQHVVGDKCDTCAENRQKLDLGCVPCPDCYGIVQKLANQLRGQLADIESLFNHTASVGNASDIRQRLSDANATAVNLLARLRNAAGDSLDMTNRRMLANLTRDIQAADSRIDASSEGLKEVANFVNDRFPQMRRNLFDLNTTIAREMLRVEAALSSAEATLAKSRELANSVGRVNQELDAREANLRSTVDHLGQQVANLTEWVDRRMREIEQLRNATTDVKVGQERAMAEANATASRVSALETLAGQAEAAVDEAKSTALDLMSRYRSLQALLQPSGLDLASLNASVSELEAETGRVEAQHRDVVIAFNETQRNLTIVLNKAAKAFAEENATDARVRSFHDRLNESLHQLQKERQRCEKHFNTTTRLLATLRDYENATAESKRKAEAAINSLDAIDRSLNVTRDSNKKTEQLLDKCAPAIQDASRRMSETERLAAQLKKSSDAIAADATQKINKANEAKESVENVKNSLEQLSDRLDSVLDKQDEADKRLAFLASQSSGARMKAVRLQGEVDGIIAEIGELVKSDGDGKFNSTVTQLHAQIDRLNSSLSGSDAPVDTNLADVLAEVTAYERDHSRQVEEIDWLIEEHKRLTKVANELAKYTDERCFYVMTRSIT